MKYSVFIFAIFLSIGACSNRAQVSDDVVESPEIIDEPIVEISPTPQAEVLEFAPTTYIQSIQARATGIEATMYSSGASFSVFDKSSIFSFTQMIAFAAPKASSKNPIGHIMFLQDGENILLASVYDNGTDVFMVSKDDATGKTYYNNLLGKAREMFVGLQIQAK